MPPTKKAGATRTATPKLSAFDAERKKLIEKRSVSTVFEWEGYGRTWHVKRPNPALVQAMKEDESSFMDFVLGHFVESERSEFLATLVADEDFDFDVIELLQAQIQEVVYAEIPLGPSSDS